MKRGLVVPGGGKAVARASAGVRSWCHAALTVATSGGIGRGNAPFARLRRFGAAWLSIGTRFALHYRAMERSDASANTILRFVRRAGLEAPALLGLELAWPLRFFLQQGLVVLAPLLGNWGARDALTNALDDATAWDDWRRALGADEAR
jgi:hypothetical protein